MGVHRALCLPVMLCDSEVPAGLKILPPLLYLPRHHLCSYPQSHQASRAQPGAMLMGCTDQELMLALNVAVFRAGGQTPLQHRTKEARWPLR